MKPAIILDMDGTLADVSSIRHHLKTYDEGKRRVIKHFDRFHEESVNVPANLQVVNAAQVAYMMGIDIIIVTARKAKWRNHTAMWLAMNNVPSNALFMRADDDSRKDYEVKKDILNRIKKEWVPIHAWDDNPSIIRLWTEEGIPCTIVPGWED